MHQSSQLYLAFVRSTTPIPVKGCKLRRMHIVTLPRVRAFDHANPCEGLQSALRRFVTLPRVRAFDHANPCEGLQVSNPCEGLQIRALDPRIPVKGCKVRALDPANPCEGLQVRRIMCHFTSRSCVRPANPCEGLQVAPHTLSLYLAFVRSTRESL